MDCQDTFLTVHLYLLQLQNRVCKLYLFKIFFNFSVLVFDGKKYLKAQTPDTITITAIT